MSRQAKSIEERFWAKVNLNGPIVYTELDQCWQWTAACEAFGYGVLSRGSRGQGLVRVHRLSWELHYGAIPDTMCVCHRCDNPACVNPGHLFLGNKLVNHQDMPRKGRASKPPMNDTDPPIFLGEAHHNHKLTDEAVRTIRAVGSGYGLLARQFGVSTTTISRVVRREAWKHVS